MKPKVDQTFANFRIFMQKEYRKHHKQNKTTAKSVGYGIANSLTDNTVEHIDHLEAQALMIAELTNRMREESQKQFKEMMELFGKSVSANSPNPTTPKGGTGGKKKKKCPHCGLEVYHKTEAVSNLRPTPPNNMRDGRARKTPEGVRRSSPQSSGNRERLISLN